MTFLCTLMLAIEHADNCTMSAPKTHKVIRAHKYFIAKWGEADFASDSTMERRILCYKEIPMSKTRLARLKYVFQQTGLQHRTSYFVVKWSWGWQAVVVLRMQREDREAEASVDESLVIDRHDSEIFKRRRGDELALSILHLGSSLLHFSW